VNTTGTKTFGTLIFFLMLSYSADAQGTSGGKNWEIGGMNPWTFYSMAGIIVVELIVMTVLLRLINSFLKDYGKAEPVKLAQESVLLQKLTGAVAVENENEIMLDHDYDGIRELDNDLPPWWKYGFYLTIIVSVVYLIHYHVANTGDLQIAEYTKEVERGKMEVAEFMKNAANNVDESNVKMLEGADLENGKQVFISTCAACHGKLGEGGVGPNLTDAYWVHGGSLADIFKSIKYGWADKGMKAWKEDLSPVQIAQITSFIRSINGTNPANGKAPQGDLYKEALQTPGDSLRTDSLKVDLPSDTTKVVASTK
jgi:cytochrome c oxidase cbb3-type subunit 3